MQNVPAQTPIQDAQIVDEGLRLQTDTARVARVGLWVLGIGFGGFLAWAMFAPLDEGVPTMGTVTIDTKRKPVQHLAGGTVKEVLVREGQVVQADEPLIKLGDASLRGEWQSLRQQYFGLRAMEGRLMAEQLGSTRISFSEDLLQAAADDAEIARHVSVQQQLVQSRRNSINATLASIQESIRGLEAQILAYDRMIAEREQQRSLLRQQLAGIRDLVAEGYAPRNQQLELERSQAEIGAAISDLQGRQTSARQSILELRQRAITQQSEFQKTADTELATVRREVGGLGERYRAASLALERTVVRAPAAGQVVGLSVQTVGAVVAPGQKIMDIVPEDESLILESKIPPHLIDRVHTGDPVDARFSAFAHAPQLVVEGKITSISQDVLNDSLAPPVPGALRDYYLARIEITPEGVAELGNRRMQPGMQVEVVVKTGERTMLTYLLHPLIKRIAASMKEE
ncbi:MAG: HlyD family type I secretion periplasmic adaptor subunit [Betaproteobacteria bacterium]|nr:HlyD family type I secretion periplasmic adaptor subunit [Betaproteobacteria bacterium]